MKQTAQSPMISSALISMFALCVTACGGGGSNTSGGGDTTASAPAPVATASPSPTPTPSPTQTGSATTTQDQMLAVMLRTHNEAREEVGVEPLALDDDLSTQALEYARELARTGRFEHSTSASRQGQGENLWAGTPSAFTFEQMSGAWIDEKRFYQHARFPFVSSTGNWQDVGHYTQIIWRDTTRLGCGLATGSGRDYLVCRYAPAGNVSGQFPY